MRTRHKRWLVSFFVTLSLLFAQQGALLHALSHLAEPASSASQQDKRLPHSTVCEKCMAFAQMDGGAPATSFAIAAQQTTQGFSAALPAWRAASIFAAYCPRAPPFLG